MKNKILINGRFLTSPQTGIQRTAGELMKAIDILLDEGMLNDCQFRFEIIYSGQLKTDLRLKHIKIVKSGMLNGNLWEQFELPLLSFGVPLINLCSIGPLLKRRQIVCVHDVSFKVNKNFFSKNFTRWYNVAIPWLMKICQHVITVSEFSKSELINHLNVPSDKIAVINNSAEHILEFGEPSAEFKVRVNELKPYCLAVSSLGANKNFNGLSKAIRKINFGNYNMLIAGGGVSALKAETDTSTCTYLGYVSDEELKYLYQGSELFVFPSFYEGFGIPPLEAMELGCPVIASKTSSIPEVLGSAAEYFDPHDIEDMGRKIESLLKDLPKLQRLKDLGYEQSSKYSWKKSAKKLVDLIQSTYGG